MKDAKGHGSNARPLRGHAYHTKTNAELQYIVRDAAAARDAMQGHSPAAENKYADQVNDASTVLGYRARGGKSDAPADALASGAKSAPAPTHDGMSSRPGTQSHDNSREDYYNPKSVNDAIASSNRAGRRVGGREAKAIHGLLKGWRG